MKHLVTGILAVLLFSSCSGPFGPSRERAIENAIAQVKETMSVAVPDLQQPEPYKYEGGGDCALVPGLSSSKEMLRYQVEIALPAGDDGLERQARTMQHWVDKGGTIRTLPYPNGPASEVDYKGGSIMAFAMQRGRTKESTGPTEFLIVASTPCVPKID
ncbi:MAG: hypothetical protein ABI857_10295 [Acidobacteriota bacterium]